MDLSDLRILSVEPVVAVYLLGLKAKNVGEQTVYVVVIQVYIHLFKNVCSSQEVRRAFADFRPLPHQAGLLIELLVEPSADRWPVSRPSGQ